MKILIIRLSSIGDIVLTTPVVRCLHSQLNCEIHYLTKSQYRDILTPNPYITKVWSLHHKLTEILPLLSSESFDYIIDLHKNIRTYIIKKKLKVKSFSFDKINLEKWLMVNLKINRLPHTHIVDRYLATVNFLSVSNDKKGLDFFITTSQKNEAQQFLQKHQISSSFISLVIGAQHATKIPSDHFLIQLCQQYHHKIILIGGPQEATKGNRIKTASGSNVYNSAGQLSLGASASIISLSKWVISPDTGMMHIAAALHKNIISIWGNTIPEFGMTPYFPAKSKAKSIIIENKGLACRPCSKIGFEKCPKKHFQCMKSLDIKNLLNVKFQSF